MYTFLHSDPMTLTLDRVRPICLFESINITFHLNGYIAKSSVHRTCYTETQISRYRKDLRNWLEGTFGSL